MPMYEVLEDRSVRRFSICLAISFLVFMAASMMQNDGGEGIGKASVLKLELRKLSGFGFVFFLFTTLCLMGLSLYGDGVSSNILKLV